MLGEAVFRQNILVVPEVPIAVIRPGHMLLLPCHACLCFNSPTCPFPPPLLFWLPFLLASPGYFCQPPPDLRYLLPSPQPRDSVSAGLAATATTSDSRCACLTSAISAHHTFPYACLDCLPHTVDRSLPLSSYKVSLRTSNFQHAEAHRLVL